VRIIYLHQYFNTPEMPGGTRSYEMARRLVKAGHEVHMVTSEREGKLSKDKKWYVTEEAGIQVHWTPVHYSNKMDYRQRIKSFLNFSWRSARRAASLGGDVVFATSTPLTIALPAVYAAKKNKIPMVFEVRDLWPELPIAIGAIKGFLPVSLARWLERFAYKNATRVVALSPGMKNGIIVTGYPEEKVVVIPNSCDLDLFKVPPNAGDEVRRRYSWLQDRPLVVYIGTIGIINGVDYLARVAAYVGNLDPEVRFVVIGSGKHEGKVRETAIELRVFEKNFFMLPPVPKRDVPAWLSAADAATSLFIDLKEMWSNSANKFFDALASGTPVVINYGGWQAELIQQTGAGLVLDVKNIEKAATELAEFIRDRDRLLKAGAAAKDLAHERFDRDKLALELERTLKAALDEWHAF